MNRSARAVLAVIAMLFALQAWAAPSGQFRSVTGNVSVQFKSQAEAKAKVGTPLEPGSVVRMGPRGEAVLVFADGQIVALVSNSILRIDEYVFDAATPEKGVFAATFVQGGARFVTGLIGARNRTGWRVSTPMVTAEVRGTDFMLGLGQGIYARVQSGLLALSNSAGTALVEAGQTAYVASPTTLAVWAAPESIPPNLFTDLELTSLAQSGGSAEGAVQANASGGMALPAASAIGLGIGAAAAAAGGGGGGDAVSTTTHH